MAKCLRIASLLCVMGINIVPVGAVIISGYRIKIEGLGTLILLGDYHERTASDADQYNLILSFLKLVAQVPNETLLNIETEEDITEYFKKTESGSLKERFEVTQVLTKLRILMSTLKEEEGLKKALQFAASDPRRSELWYIVRIPDLRVLTRDALKKSGDSSKKLEMFYAFEEDNHRILERYLRFLTRASRELPEKLYKAVEEILSKKVSRALRAKKTLMDLFSHYTAGKPLRESSILAIIYHFAQREHPELMKDFSKSAASEQEIITDTITKSFFQKAGKQFREEYYLPMANLPWLFDSFNAFLTPRNAKRAIFYAGNLHILHMVEFMQDIQKALAHDGTIRFIQISNDDKPLSLEVLEKILALKAEKEIIRLRNAVASLKKQNEQRAQDAQQLETLRREVEHLKMLKSKKP